MQAHAPGFVRRDGLWYMVGEDRSHSWNPDLPRTKTIVFPVFFDDTRCLFDYRDRFSINFTTGERRDTP